MKKYLRKCVASVISQTYNNLEIILVDDGSTDGSDELCDQLLKKDSRIVVLHKQNGGLSDARNYGIKYATGNYITFIDSDDIVSQKMIEKLLWLIKEYNADISICDPVHIFSDKDSIYEFTDATGIKILDKEEALNMMFYQKDFLVSAWGKLDKKNLFNRINFPVGMLFEDSAIMYKLFYSSDRIIYTNAKYYGYFHRENSITTKKFSKSDLDILKICRSLINFSKKHPEFQSSIKSYTVNANFRIYLNAPRNNEYGQVIIGCQKYIIENAKDVLLDKKVRKKLKLALVLFFTNRKLLMKIYPKINRWK